MKKRFLIATILLIWTAAAIAEEQKTILLPSQRGDVNFEHQKHINLQNSCAPCHVSDKGGKIEGFNKEMAHNICAGCHEKQSAGPTTTQCSGCHK